MLRTLLATVLKSLIVICSVIFVILFAFTQWAPMPFAARKLIGHSRCSWAETLRASGFLDRYREAFQRIESGRRLIHQDGDLQLWDVPGARAFWLRGSFARLNAIAFAEQAADNYWHPRVHIHAGDIVLDCGADYGAVTWRALAAGAARVIAIEIDPEKIPCLNRTFATEVADGRVTVVPLGLWDRVGTLELGGDSVVMQRDPHKRRVPVTTMDRIVADLHLPRVDFIAMDIEGAEKSALRGGERTLKTYHPRMVIAAEHLPDDIVAIPDLVRALAGDSYNVICGRCEILPAGLVPSVLFFEPSDQVALDDHAQLDSAL